MINIRTLWVLFLFLFSYGTSAQSFDQKVSSAELELPSEKISGFSTTIDFQSEKVKLGWWQYAKKFSLPKNQRTHYEVTIPATNDSKAMIIYSQWEEDSRATNFKLGIKTDAMSADEKKKYLGQAKAILIDFKRWLYLRHYEEQLANMEENLPSSFSTNYAPWLEFVINRETILNKMREI